MGCILKWITHAGRANIVDSYSAYLQIPEATFLQPSFSLMRFQHALRADGGNKLRSLVPGAQSALTELRAHAPGTAWESTAVQRCGGSSPGSNAVDTVMAQVLHVLHSPLVEERKWRPDDSSLHERTPVAIFCIYDLWRRWHGVDIIVLGSESPPQIRRDHKLLRTERSCAMLHKEEGTAWDQSCESTPASLETRLANI